MLVETTLCVCFHVHVERWGVCVCGVMVVCVFRESQGSVSGRSAEGVCVYCHVYVSVCVCVCVCVYAPLCAENGLLVSLCV